MPYGIDQLFVDYGILPTFVFMSVCLALSSPHLGQLIATLAILSGIYIAILKIFELNLDLGIFDLTIYTKVTGEQGDIIVGTVFILAFGILVYFFKSSLEPKEEP